MYGIVVATTAYVSDTTTPQTRSRDFSVMESIFIIFNLAGPTLGAWLYSVTGSFLFPVNTSISLIVLACVWLALFVPESLKSSPLKKHEPHTVKELVSALDTVSAEASAASTRRRGGSISSLHRTGSLRRAGSITTPLASRTSTDDSGRPLPHVVSKRDVVLATNREAVEVADTILYDMFESLKLLLDKPVFLLAVVQFLFVFSGSGTGSYLLLYLNFRFGLICKMMCLMFFFPGILAWFQNSASKKPQGEAEEEGEALNAASSKSRTTLERTVFEIRLLAIGLVFVGAGYSSILFAAEVWHLFLIMFLESFGSYVGALLNSMISKTVRENAQGRIMAAISLSQTLSGTAGATLVPLLYTSTVKTAPGISLLYCGLSAIVCIVIIQFIDRRALAHRMDEVVKADEAARARVDEEVFSARREAEDETTVPTTADAAESGEVVRGRRLART
ncbi:hypothetical protein HDU96_002202 [Phlyctochytrium bullatum]|nr:hypothetical protein HDU96_002202 [Phlyctochytrium bullatum]